MTANQIAYWSHAESKEHNRNTEQETKRHNTEMESLERAKLAVSKAQLALSGRIADQNFILGKQNNLIQQQRADDQRDYWVSSLAEQNRSNITREQETYRHNLETEIATTNANLLRGEELEVRQQELDVKQRQHDLDVYTLQWNMIKDSLLGKGSIFESVGKIIPAIISSG